ncbi:MAG: hypothetical protein WAL56_24560, partial [Candidatus Sulfotelmatobacter sp.]
PPARATPLPQNDKRGSEKALVGNDDGKKQQVPHRACARFGMTSRLILAGMVARREAAPFLSDTVVQS